MKIGTTNANPSINSGVANSVTIGDFTISQFGDGTLWIEDAEEDAGSFDEALFAKAIRQFYDANF